MKIKEIMISNNLIEFIIGENKQDNHNIIDMAKETDLWFHADEHTSCHVISKIPEKIDKKLLRKIIIQGALLCKQNTKKLCNIKDVEICYTEIKNIHKTNIIGTVEFSNYKIIKI